MDRSDPSMYEHLEVFLYRLDSGRCGFIVDDRIIVPDIEHLPYLCRYVCNEIERKGPSRQGCDGLGNADNATSFLSSTIQPFQTIRSLWLNFLP